MKDKNLFMWLPLLLLITSCKEIEQTPINDTQTFEAVMEELPIINQTEIIIENITKQLTEKEVLTLYAEEKGFVIPATEAGWWGLKIKKESEDKTRCYYTTWDNKTIQGILGRNSSSGKMDLCFASKTTRINSYKVAPSITQNNQPSSNEPGNTCSNPKCSWVCTAWDSWGLYCMKSENKCVC